MKEVVQHSLLEHHAIVPFLTGMRPDGKKFVLPFTREVMGDDPLALLKALRVRMPRLALVSPTTTLKGEPQEDPMEIPADASIDAVMICLYEGVVVRLYYAELLKIGSEWRLGKWEEEDKKLAGNIVDPPAEWN